MTNKKRVGMAIILFAAAFAGGFMAIPMPGVSVAVSAAILIGLAVYLAGGRND